MFNKIYIFSDNGVWRAENKITKQNKKRRKPTTKYDFYGTQYNDVITKSHFNDTFYYYDIVSSGEKWRFV